MFDPKMNCPHCGAPIESPKCPYCGTLIVDFANIDINIPTYLRVKTPNGGLCWFKAVPVALTFKQEPDSFPVFTAEFCIIPDKDVYMQMFTDTAKD